MTQLVNPFRIGEPKLKRPQDDFLSQIKTGATGPSPLQIVDEPEQPEVPGFLDSLSTSFRTQSIIGAASERLYFEVRDKAVIGDELDTNFNVIDMLTPELVQKHPFLIDDTENGSVFEIPNPRAFNEYVLRRQARIDELEGLSRRGFASSLLISGLAQVPDIATGGFILKSLGIIGAGKTGAGIAVGRALRGTTASARSATTRCRSTTA